MALDENANVVNTSNYKSVASFLALMRSNPFANASKYWFNITEAPSLLGLSPDAKRSLSYRCSKITIPDSDIDSETAWYPQMSENIAKGRKYGDLACTFYCTDGMPELRTFDRWMSIIYDQPNARCAYKNTYTAKVEVEQLDRNGNKKSVWTFYDVFPSKVGTLNMSYESRNTIVTLDVTFNYTYWELAKTGEGESEASQ